MGDLNLLVDLGGTNTRVALADGARGHEEDGFLRLVANLLGVNDRDSGHARQAAERRITG